MTVKPPPSEEDVLDDFDEEEEEAPQPALPDLPKPGPYKMLSSKFVTDPTKFKKPVATLKTERAERDFLRPDLERLLSIVGSRNGKDIKRHKNLAFRDGALRWISKQTPGKYYLDDTDLDGDGVPEVAIRDYKDNLYAINGYRTAKADRIFENQYMEEFPTRKLRKGHDYDEWVKQQLKFKTEEKYGLDNTWDENNEHYKLAKMNKFKTHVTKTNSVIRAFTQRIIVPLINETLEKLYTDSKNNIDEKFGVPQGVNPTEEQQRTLVRKYLGILPTATTAVANKVFHLTINALLQQLYPDEFKAALKTVYVRMKKRTLRPENINWEKEVMKYMSSKKPFKEAQRSLYKSFIDDRDDGDQANYNAIIVPAFNAVWQELLQACNGGARFTNVWGEPVTVCGVDPDDFAGWDKPETRTAFNDKYKKYVGAKDKERQLANRKSKINYAFGDGMPALFGAPK